MTRPGSIVAEPRRDYMAYLLRLWRVKDGGKTGWRASLENAHTGERKGFAGLDELFAFLRQQTNDDTEESACPSGHHEA